jgi:hypothetical protein
LLLNGCCALARGEFPPRLNALYLFGYESATIVFYLLSLYRTLAAIIINPWLIPQNIVPVS